jgi:hypothetical protein
MTLMTHLRLSPWAMVGLILAAVLTLFGLAMTTKVIIGKESLIYYHHEIAVMVSATVLLWPLRQPVPLYLDVAILGAAMFPACGCVGCLMVGCRRGWPHRWSDCHREEHAGAGFTPCVVGVLPCLVQTGFAGAPARG